MGHRVLAWGPLPSPLSLKSECEKYKHKRGPTHTVSLKRKQSAPFNFKKKCLEFNVHYILGNILKCEICVSSLCKCSFFTRSAINSEKLVLVNSRQTQLICGFAFLYLPEIASKFRGVLGHRVS